MENSFEVFKYVEPLGNDMLSMINKHRMQEIIYYLDKYYLELRGKLLFSEDVTMGIEIEYETNESLESSKRSILNVDCLSDWNVDRDTSDRNVYEVDSAVFRNNLSDWMKVKEACNIIENRGGFITNNCGGHVHIGAHILGDDRNSWLNFIRLWAAYEKIIYRFVYGEYLTPRKRIVGFAPLSGDTFLEDYDKLKDSKKTTMEMVRELSHKSRTQAVNFLNVYDLNDYDFLNTIEFRCPNGTLDPIVWQNNINLLVHLLLYSKSSNFDNDFISKKCSEKQRGNRSMFFGVDLSGALELGDLVFGTNLDKLYFLRQYLKNYEIGSVYLENARPFTKSYHI